MPLPEEEVVQKVPDRFKKELETEKEEKFKAKTADAKGVPGDKENRDEEMA